MIKNFSAVLFLVCLLFTALPNAAYACSCARQGNALEQYDIVFRGTVTKSGEKNIGILADKNALRNYSTFKVSEVYKGIVGDEIEIFYRVGSGSSCGLAEFEHDAEYIIHSNRDEDGSYQVGFCSPKTKVEALYEYINPHYLPSLARLAMVSESIKAVDALIEENPNVLAFYLKKAQILAEIKDSQRLEELYIKALQVAKGDEINDVYYSLWQSQYLMGRFDDALDALKKSGRSGNEQQISIALLYTNSKTDLNGSPIDLSDSTLSGVDMSDLEFPNSDFSNSRLYQVILNNTKLVRANFDKAYVRSNNKHPNNIDLSEANFRNAEVLGVFEQATFSKSNFSNAELSGTFLNSNFAESSFEGAELNGNFSGVNFTSANLTGAFLKGNYDDANFTGANLLKAKIAGDLHRADFTDAILNETAIHKLTGANVSMAKIISLSDMPNKHSNGEPDYSEVDLSNRDFSNAVFYGTDFKNAKLVDTSFKNARVYWYIREASFQGADLSGADLTDTYLSFVKYDCNTQFPKDFNPVESHMIPIWDSCEGERPDINFSGVTFPDDKEFGHVKPYFVMRDFSKVDFSKSNFVSMVCESCNLNQAVFDNLKIHFTRLIGATFKGASFANTDLLGSVFYQADIRGADFTTAILSNAKFKAAVYDNTTKWPVGFDPVQAGAVLSE